MQFILYVTGKPNLHGLRKREFLWRPEHGCYVFEGRTIEEKEFNLLVPQVLRRYEEMHVSIKIVTPDTELKDTPTIESPPSEITADQAEEILRRLAPERLKKPPRRAA